MKTHLHLPGPAPAWVSRAATAAICTLLTATLSAGTYPASGTQGFSYADGTLPGTPAWDDGTSVSATGDSEPAPPPAVQLGALRLTTGDAVTRTASLQLPDLDPGQDIAGFTVNFSVRLAASGTPGHGFSLNFGAIPPGDGDGEVGYPLPHGIVVAWETHAAGDGAPGIAVYANQERIASVPLTLSGDSTFRQAVVTWDGSALSVTWDGAEVLQNIATPGVIPAVGDRFAFSARTSPEAFQEIALDDLRISTVPAGNVSTGGPVISEFVAANSGGFEDEDVESPDWFEIYNGSDAPVSLEGWHATDDPALPAKWTFPAVTIPAYGYRVVYASGKDRRDPAGQLHTNFALSRDAGHLALVKPDMTVASEYTYGPQVENVAYGEVGTARRRGYLETPTPNARNVSLVADGPPAEEVVFSSRGGLIAGPDPVTLSIAPPSAPGAVVRYSLSQIIPGETSPVYSEPFAISDTITVRARVFEPGRLPGPVSTRTFLKLDPSLTSYNGSGQVFSSNLPVLVFDSFGTNVDATSDPGSARPFRPGYAVVIAPDPVTGRASLAAEPDYAGRSGFHVRGESSAGFAQKSYAWETWDEYNEDRDEPILGLPAESDWVLHGPYSEKSLMRNYLVYSTFHEAHTDGWFAPRTRFVEVFFNQQKGQPVSYSDYKGVYLLVEKIKRSRNRLRLEKINPLVTDPALITGGYIFKKDKASLGTTRWTTSRGVDMQGSTPEKLPTPQLTYLRGYINNFESVLNSSAFSDPVNGYAAWIDVKSFIDWQWAVEIPKQIDGYVFSTYFHKDRNGLMRAGPLWDFNISLGNADYAEGERPTGWNYASSDNTQLSGSLWFPRLHADPNYKVATFDRYWELRRSLWETTAIFARIDEAAALLQDGLTDEISNNTPLTVQSPVARHYRKYKILGSRQWPNPASATSRKTWQAEIAALRDWISARLDWLDNQFAVGSMVMRPPVVARTKDGASEVVTLAPFAGSVPGCYFPAGVIHYTTDGTDPRPAGSRIPTTQTVAILGEYGTASWFVPTATNGGADLPLEAWTGLADPPNAAQWTSGQLGIGYDTEPTSSANPFKYHLAGAHPGDVNWDGGTSNLQDAMFNQSSSVFVRVPFQLTGDQLERLVTLEMRIRYDDGFIAFVNGVEAARLNVKPSTTAAWNAVADDIPANFNDTRATTGATVNLSSAIGSLRPGTNILAILALNRSADDTDLLCSPSLSGRVATRPAGLPEPVAPVYTGPLTVSSTTTVKARVFVPETGMWSPLTTSTVIVGAVPATRDNLVISEIHYAPLPPTPEELAAGAVDATEFEFVEFLNTGPVEVDLSGLRFSAGSQEFHFSQGDPLVRTIPPGGQVVLCGRIPSFRLRHPNPAIRIAGEIPGNLSNSGETITLRDASGNILWSFAYGVSAPWPDRNSSPGSNIVLINPLSHPAPDPSLGANWRASGITHGTPGAPDHAPPGDLPPFEDADGDGLANVLESLLGSNPADPRSTGRLEVSAMQPDSTVRLSFPRHPQVEGYQLAVQMSTDLVTWQPADPLLSPAGEEPGPNGTVIEFWDLTVPSDAPAAPLFLRLAATASGP